MRNAVPTFRGLGTDLGRAEVGGQARSPWPNRAAAPAPEHEYAAGHIEHAVSIPLDELDAHVAASES